jgi:actin related protein 2/3 complex subunit 2
MHIRCWAELEGYGALDIMRREYGNLLSATTEPEYNVSLEIDLAGVPPEGGAKY